MAKHTAPPRRRYSAQKHTSHKGVTPDRLIGAVLTLELEQTTELDGSVHCAVRGPKLHVTVTHYDAGKSNVRTYLFRDYTPELAQAHGVRAAYPSFGYDHIRQTAQTYINSEFLELA